MLVCKFYLGVHPQTLNMESLKIVYLLMLETRYAFESECDIL